MMKIMKYVPLALYLLAFVFAFFVQSLTHSFASALFFGLLLFSVGIQGIWAWFGHCFYSESVAQSIGWPSSPFQNEVGYANLAFGIGGILAFFWPILAPGVAIGIIIFMLSAAWGHAREMIKAKNFAPGNAGPIFYTDILVPVTLIICLLNLVTIIKT